MSSATCDRCSNASRKVRSTRALSLVISHRLPLDQAPHGYKMFRDKQDGCLKVVLTLADDEQGPRGPRSVPGYPRVVGGNARRSPRLGDRGGGALQRAGIIDYHRGWINILDGARLEAATCEDYQLSREAYDRLYEPSSTRPTTSRPLALATR